MPTFESIIPFSYGPWIAFPEKELREWLVIEQLKSYGVRVMSHQEPWLDTAGPVSDLLMAVFAWVAQQERARIRERVMAGLKTAKAKGKKLGRPSRGVNLAKARDLKSKGHSLRQIAQFLGVPRSTLARVLSQKPHAVAA